MHTLCQDCDNHLSKAAMRPAAIETAAMMMQVFLDGLKASLTADNAFQNGWYHEKPTVGLRAFARVYAGWGFSQPFYWNEASTQLYLSA